MLLLHFGRNQRENPNEWVVKSSLCTRMDYLNSACDALAFLVDNACLTVFFALAVIGTAGFASSFKFSFSQNAFDGIVHAASIPISIVGIISPQTINQDFREITVEEVKKEVDPESALSEAANILGGIVLRKRRPIKISMET
jgi:hypothetical protein